MNRPGEIDVSVFLEQQRAEKKKREIPNINYKYVSAKEYAELVQMHHVTVLRFLGEGKIDGAVKIGSVWRIPVKE